MLDWINTLFEQDTGQPPSSLTPGLKRVLAQLLRECEQIYRTVAQRRMFEFQDRVPENLSKYEELLCDLHRGVLIKTLIDIAHCDRRWSWPEKEVAVIVMQHVWKVQVSNDAMAQALQNIISHSEQLKWEDLFKPLVDMPELHEEAESLRSVVLRLANLIAKADGHVLASELTQLERLRKELDQVFSGPASEQSKQLSSGPIAMESDTAEPDAAKLVRSSVGKAGRSKQAAKPSPAKAASAPELALSAEQRQQMLEAAQHELQALIGLDSIKQDVRQLVDFLRVQRYRLEHQLPTANISLHAVFEGNPGTGKTTVARILARLLCGLSILEKGQTVELDRSGLVAQYAGQTGPRTNARVDEALGGLLFIDEAYSLMSDQGEDVFGTEAVQTLLKRMEDDRDRVVVVLAGYPEPMRRMLKSNPGLSSRFQRVYRFDDYSARDLLRIYHTFCKKYHYRLPKSTQQKLLGGFRRLIEGKDEHFGNGRLARNLFESSIRHMSTRIVGITPLTRELLTTIEPEDITFDA